VPRSPSSSWSDPTPPHFSVVAASCSIFSTYWRL
jgi:hypothetical protein